ncbi:MAG: hypothetical protein B7X49_12615 [Acidiphilium sp. 34-64-41]|nr:MAG: hypothetical protein B7X49_12615 [Acidiphilium sp. 34-64-41]
MASAGVMFTLSLRGGGWIRGWLQSGCDARDGTHDPCHHGGLVHIGEIQGILYVIVHISRDYVLKISTDTA